MTLPPRGERHATASAGSATFRAGDAVSAGTGRLSHLTLRRPQLLALAAVAAALTVLVGGMPIVGRGDYGQWLMTSGYYLGDDVPEYRSITALPPLVPLLLAAVRLVVADPVAALQMLNVLMLLALLAGIYVAAATVFARWDAGLFAVTLSFLVTDRFLELFAFGGLLQAASLFFMLLSVAALVRAGREPGVKMLWWTLGGLALALAVMSHVGTGVIAVPVCFSVGLVSVVRMPRSRWRRLIGALLPAAVILSAVLVYWVVVLLPASDEYVTNPASLSYRGVDRLFKALQSYWPTVAVLVLGAGSLVVGARAEAVGRRPGPFLYLFVWAVVVWGGLLLSVVVQASTDYPRFATPLLAPLVVAAAGGLATAVRSVAGRLDARVPSVGRIGWVLTMWFALSLVAAPSGFQRYANHTGFYQPIDGEALSVVSAWLADELQDGESVLSEVREGKWIEGITGNAALFSQPVRYAFRAAEWQRSIAAEALMRSTSALTNEYFFAKFTHSASTRAADVPRGIVVAANHEGEYVDLLRIPSGETAVFGAEQRSHPIATLINLEPVKIERTSTTDGVTVETSWRGERGGSEVGVVETVSLRNDSPTLEIVDLVTSPRATRGVEVELWPLHPVTAIRSDRSARQADVYFIRMGLNQPHLRVEIVNATGVIEVTEDETLRVRSSGPGLHLKITIRTPGPPVSGLQILDPRELIRDYGVAAVVLLRDTPAFEPRRHRFEALGFELVLEAGAYAVMARD